MTTQARLSTADAEHMDAEDMTLEQIDAAIELIQAEKDKAAMASNYERSRRLSSRLEDLYDWQAWHDEFGEIE